MTARATASRIATACRICRRQLSTAPESYASSAAVLPPEQQLEQLGRVEPSSISLNDLVRFGAAPLSPDALVALGEYTRYELPLRLARRVKAHSSLPYIVASNPHIGRIHELYRTSFAKLVAEPPIKTVEDNERYTNALHALVQQHSDNIPVLAQGFRESRRFMPDEAITAFLDKAIRSRIAIRLIAENHISLSSQKAARPDSIGIVDLACSPRQLLRQCADFVSDLCEGTYGRTPELIIDGDVDARFAYVDVHLEYILTELLKNAFRATAEKHASAIVLPPVHATIAWSPQHGTLSLRIRDAGGGIPSQYLRNVFSYAFTTVTRDAEDDPDAYSTMAGGAIGQPDMQTPLGSIAGQGYGLPLSRLYAQYFRGSLELVSLHPHGTDCFVVLGSRTP